MCQAFCHLWLIFNPLWPIAKGENLTEKSVGHFPKESRKYQFFLPLPILRVFIKARPGH
ncbi:hypothetical protein EMIT0P260_40292 [Pseudomonas sp. IT-P260]